jgi:hypothetical protein
MNTREEKLNLCPRAFSENGWEPNINFMLENEWGAIVISDWPDFLFLEWLTDYFRTSEIDEPFLLSYGGDLIDAYGCDEFDPKKIFEISDLIFELQTRSRIITDLSLSFIYFLSAENDYFIISGPKTFLETAYRGNVGLAEKIFWKHKEGEQEKTIRYYREIFKKLATILPKDE